MNFGEFFSGKFEAHTCERVSLNGRSSNAIYNNVIPLMPVIFSVRNVTMQKNDGARGGNILDEQSKNHNKRKLEA